MNVRRTTLVVAIILAVGTGWLTLQYLSTLRSQYAPSGEQRTIVVAASEIPARVPITMAMLHVVTRPASVVEPDAIANPQQAIGALSLITIPIGGTITASKIGHPSAQALPVRLTPGMRAVSIEIDRVKGVSGLVQPGDLVDVIAIPPRTGNGPPPPAATILRGVRVLALGNTLEYSSATPSPQEANATTVTLEVTPSQADLLAMADVDTTLRLALRSPREKIGSHPPEALRFPGGSVASASERAPSDPKPQRYAWSVPVIDGTADSEQP
jgi:pilus assembly protein CpaB